MRRIVPRLVVAVMLGLIISGGFLGFKAMEIHHMGQDFMTQEQERLSLRTALLAQASELAGLRGKYDRVATFNNKLKVMLNMAEVSEAESALGGSNLAFARASITPYNMRSLVRNMQNGTESLDRDILDAERVQQTVLREMRHDMNILAWTPSVWPVKGRITSSFGMRNHPFDSHYRMHQGLDIVPSTGRGTPVLAPANGVVARIERKGAYGLTLLLRHFGGINTRYAHLRDVTVEEGQTVGRDEVIAHVGNSGRSTGPHLHYEVLVDGSARNPRGFILN
ncbi:MAG: M23 family metallopeptidase [Proteobacteria bacterium]|nr:M23 family metallopeptidase [Pseudomonadota bacterium]MBU1612717.1 M23 family metallopeptidase [Pseudomonadota bacterium]